MTVFGGAKHLTDSSGTPAMFDIRRRTSGAAQELFDSVHDEVATAATWNTYLMFRGGTLPVEVSRVGREYLAADSLVSRWALAATREQSLDQLWDDVSEYYLDLVAHGDRLSPRLEEHRRILARLLGEDAEL